MPVAAMNVQKAAASLAVVGSIAAMVAAPVSDQSCSITGRDCHDSFLMVIRLKFI
jgi:hypothetical protein